MFANDTRFIWSPAPLILSYSSAVMLVWYIQYSSCVQLMISLPDLEGHMTETSGVILPNKM